MAINYKYSSSDYSLTFVQTCENLGLPKEGTLVPQNSKVQSRKKAELLCTHTVWQKHPSLQD